MSLAQYGADPLHSRGRRHAEPAPTARTEFQRDRDRVIHSAAFRRLVYKTQVFVNHEGDLFRTRLTHSLEVAQIARTIARNLGLNEDLSEAISLAHDLGHTPFGHAGQEALNQCMADHGGFEHNLQSLRVVDELEDKYADFRGLNLSFETREGILKHCSRRNAKKLGDVGQRFLDRSFPSAEAQLANLADVIAYNNHDVDDGLRAGLLSFEQLSASRLFARVHAEVAGRYADLQPKQLRHEVIRRMINELVLDLTEQTRRNIADSKATSIDEIRQAQLPIVAFSEPMGEQSHELQQLLRSCLYRHPRVMRNTLKAQKVLSELFAAFSAHPDLLPESFRRAAEQEGVPRAVADYIAGMTDRFAIDEYERLFDPRRL